MEEHHLMCLLCQRTGSVARRWRVEQVREREERQEVGRRQRIVCTTCSRFK